MIDLDNPLYYQLEDTGRWKPIITGGGIILLAESIDAKDTETDNIFALSFEGEWVCLLSVFRHHMPTLNRRLARGTDASVIGAINRRMRDGDGFLYEIQKQVASYQKSSIVYSNGFLTVNNLPLWKNLTPQP